MIKPTKVNVAIAVGFITALALFVYGVILGNALFPQRTDAGQFETLKVMFCLYIGGMGISVLGFELYERHHDRTQEFYYHPEVNRAESE